MPSPSRVLARLLVGLALLCGCAAPAVALAGCGDDVKVNSKDKGPGDDQSPVTGDDANDDDPGDQ